MQASAAGTRTGLPGIAATVGVEAEVLDGAA